MKMMKKMKKAWEVTISQSSDKYLKSKYLMKVARSPRTSSQDQAQPSQAKAELSKVYLSKNYWTLVATMIPWGQHHCQRGWSLIRREEFQGARSSWKSLKMMLIKEHTLGEMNKERNWKIQTKQVGLKNVRHKAQFRIRFMINILNQY